MGEEKYTIAEEFELPSKGLIYEKPVKSQVKLRSMTMRDEMKRTSKSDRPNCLLAEIVEGCMVEKPAIPVADMCLGDYEYLVHKLRLVSHGEIYEMTALCPFCGNVEDLKVNLDQEEVKEFDEGKFKDLLTVKLPKSGKEITLYYQTPRIVDTIKLKAEEARKKAADQSLDYERLIKLQELINTVDGAKLNYIQKENFINNLPANDVVKIEQRIDKINDYIGLKNDIKFKCGKCGEEVLTFFRYTSEFFKPSNDE